MRHNIVERFKAISSKSLRTILPEEIQAESWLKETEIVSHVFPFRVNAYVLNELIRWPQVPDDPIFRLLFPQKEMLLNDEFEKLKAACSIGDKQQVTLLTASIRNRMNPHPANQMENRPVVGGKVLTGIQHKYQDAVLFFPSKGQTCHAYCSFCFRWPQFIGQTSNKFGKTDVKTLCDYLETHPEVRSVLLTGGDPLIMSTNNLAEVIRPLLAGGQDHITSVRIGTKSFGFWPGRFINDPDAGALLKLFEKVVSHKKHLAIMAHFSHYHELETPKVQSAIRAVLDTGAVIRTQSPVLRGVNDDPQVWKRMWEKQVHLGCIPYYMFISRNTGAHHYFSIPLVRAIEIYKEAIRGINGLSLTVRGPVMSTAQGKVELLDAWEMAPDRFRFTLRFIRHRNPHLAGKVFTATGSSEAYWLSDLIPENPDHLMYFHPQSAAPEQDLIAES